MTDTVIHLLRKAAEKFSNRAALVGHRGLRDDAWTYLRLLNAVDNVAWRMKEVYRFAPGDRILIQGVNSPQLVASYLGCYAAGLIVVPLDRFSSRDFIAHIIRLTQAKAMISNDETLSLPELRTISPDTLVNVTSEHKPLEYEPGADDIAEIVFTSGTTGSPKGVMLTHRNIVTNVNAIEHVYPRGRTLRFMSLLPLSHMFEQTAGLFTPLCLGATIYYDNRLQTMAIMRKLEQKSIDGVIAVPQMVEMIFHGLEKQVMDSGLQARWRIWWKIAERVPFKCRRYFTIKLFPAMNGTPRFFVCGGSPLPAITEQRWEQLGVRVIQGYGTTECAPVISVNQYDKRIRGSVGWPVNCVRLEIADNGEILVQGDNVSPGYWRNPEATKAAFTRQRFYKTGDMGEFGASGELYIKGRNKDMIVLANGMNVYPEDIEQILSKQPGVMSCMVASLADDQGIQNITGIICLHQDLDEEEKQAAAETAVRNTNAQLAPHQRVRAIRLWHGDFPRTSLLKIQRWKVKAQLAAEQQTANALQSEMPVRGSFTTIEQLLAHVCRVPHDSISDNTDMDLDLGCSSLARVELAGLIEEHLGIICDDAELIAIHQVGELKALIARSQQGGKRVRFPDWPLSSLARAVRTGLQSLLLVPLHKLLCTSFDVRGLENLQNLQGPVMFIANHASHVDTLSILRAMPVRIRQQLSVAAAADYFFRYAMVADCLALLINAFAFSREGSIRNSLEHCGELMDKGWSLLIYPEGTRSPSGQLLDFKPGIGLLATGLGVPVVPIAVEGGYYILPKGCIWPTRNPVKVTFGKALYFPSSMNKQHATSLLHDSLSDMLRKPALIS